jgi:hypothetical protein
VGESRDQLIKLTRLIADLLVVPRSRATTTRALAVSATVIAALIAGCSVNGPASGTGDPGSVRLHDIATDPALNALPPDSLRHGGLIKKPAVWDSIYSFWNGPYVTSAFSSTRTIEAVFRFYARRAATDGWTADIVNPLGLVGSWDKTYPAGVTAHLDLHEPGDPRNARHVEAGFYNLTESADPIRKS